MANTIKGVSEDINSAVHKLRIRTFAHKALPPDKQKEFTKQARVMLDRISSLENNTEAAIKLV